MSENVRDRLDQPSERVTYGVLAGSGRPKWELFTQSRVITMMIDRGVLAMFDDDIPVRWR